MVQSERRFPRHVAVALKAAVETLSNTARGSIWLVPEPICRVYVLAIHDGEDPFLAIRKAWFGEPVPWRYAAFADRSSREWLAGLKAVPVEIPRARA